jgi:molybdenum cofactor biosynthesis enzyme MoaA
MRPGTKYDFANILFAGPCNQRCPYCIGQQLPTSLNPDNLDEFPPRNFETYIALVKQHSVQQITLTGTNTDPQLYQHEARLLRCLRASLPAAQISLHTNGQLAREKMDTFNMYDRATISFPSFAPQTFARMSGTQHMPDLATILQESQIPIKVSCVVSEQNAHEIKDFVANCRSIGVRRLVLRKLYGDNRQWSVLPGLEPTQHFRGNPVYDYRGMEVTYWRFENTTATSLNLFADGTISAEYLLTKAA